MSLVDVLPKRAEVGLVRPKFGVLQDKFQDQETKENRGFGKEALHGNAGIR